MTQEMNFKLARTKKNVSRNQTRWKTFLFYKTQQIGNNQKLSCGLLLCKSLIRKLIKARTTFSRKRELKDTCKLELSF
jgi:hypothetical protein